METFGPRGIGFTMTDASVVPTNPTRPNIRKIPRQPNTLSKGPPTTTPIVGAPVMANWNQPTARARSAWPNACISNAMPDGMSKPPHRPKMTRTAMKLPMLHTQ